MLFRSETASADLIELRCDGITYIHEKGLGVAPLEATDTRIIKVNVMHEVVGNLESNTLHGKRTAPVLINEESFEATLLHGFNYKGTYIYGEKVFINRYTGTIVSFYVSSGQDTGGPPAFVGTCKKGTRKF